MKKEHYIPVVDDWYLGTDGISFILFRKKITTDPDAKHHGKERYEPMGYYASLGSFCVGLHRYLSMEVLARGGASSLEEYVRELSREIGRVTRLDDAMINMLKEQMGVER